VALDQSGCKELKASALLNMKVSMLHMTMKACDVRKQTSQGCGIEGNKGARFSDLLEIGR
jgi:hypothetical protein